MASAPTETLPAMSSSAQPVFTRLTLRYLALLLLLTPLVGGVHLLARPAASALPQVVTQVIEVPQMIEVPQVPQTIYVMVPVPTVVVVEVPAAAGAVEPPAAEEQGEALQATAAPGDETGEAAAVAEQGSGTPPAALVRGVAARPVARAASVSPAESPAEEPTVVSPAAPTDEPLLAEAEGVSDEPPASTPVADKVPEAVAAARRSLTEFYAYTDSNWSVQGYSSAEEMRQALGNSQSNWLDQTKKVAAQEQPVTTPVLEELPPNVADEPGDGADGTNDDRENLSNNEESSSDDKKGGKSQNSASNRSDGESKGRHSRR